MDVSYVLPIIIGLPLSLTVNATVTVGLKMSDGKLSTSIEVKGLMSVDASTFGLSGVQVQNTMYTSTGLSSKLMIQGKQIVAAKVDALEEACNTFSFD